MVVSNKSTVTGKLILNENAYTQSLKELNKLDIGKLFEEKSITGKREVPLWDLEEILMMHLLRL